MNEGAVYVRTCVTLCDVTARNQQPSPNIETITRPHGELLGTFGSVRESSTIKNQYQIKSLQNTQLIYKITQMSTRVKGTWISSSQVVIVVRYVSGAGALSGMIKWYPGDFALE